MAQAAQEKEKVCYTTEEQSTKLLQGNAAFKAGDYPTAIGHYSAAIHADRTDATFPLNRAAAYLKLGKYVSARLHNSYFLSTSVIRPAGTKTRSATAQLF
jgi:Flp pilus assembly protein TadD